MCVRGLCISCGAQADVFGLIVGLYRLVGAKPWADCHLTSAAAHFRVRFYLEILLARFIYSSGPVSCSRGHQLNIQMYMFDFWAYMSHACPMGRSEISLVTVLVVVDDSRC